MQNNNQNNNQNPKNSQKPEIRTANNSKGWITEKCGTNNPPANPPQRPSTENKTN